MQILPQTARGMGYAGTAQGLLDAETNLKYAVKYLRGAYLTADGFADSGSGIVRYVVRYSTSPLLSCDEGSPAYDGPSATARHEPSDQTAIYYYAACAFDAAGNRSAAAPAVAAPGQRTGAPR